jgi:hypothetical protein
MLGIPQSSGLHDEVYVQKGGKKGKKKKKSQTVISLVS